MEFPIQLQYYCGKIEFGFDKVQLPLGNEMINVCALQFSFVEIDLEEKKTDNTLLD